MQLPLLPRLIAKFRRWQINQSAKQALIDKQRIEQITGKKTFVIFYGGKFNAITKQDLKKHNLCHKKKSARKILKGM